MPISTIADLSNLINAGLAGFRTRFQGKNTDLWSFLGTTARSFAMGVFSIQRAVEQVDNESPPNSKTSTLGVQTWAVVSGVPSNQGGYGENGAVAAAGGLGSVTGTSGTTVLQSQQLLGPDGVTLFELDATGTIPFTGSFSAVTAGSVGDLASGDVLTWVTPPTGCDPTVTLSTALSGGLDEESIPALLQRTIEQWQTPPTGGNATDYDNWESAVAGVAGVFVYPRRGGSGTVHIVIVEAGTGTARQPSDALLTMAQAAADSKKPSDVDEVLVVGPEMPEDTGLTIHATAFMATGYSWDWNDTGDSWTVSSYDASPATLTLNTAPDPTLVQAVQDGLQPLVQVISSGAGAPPIPDQVAVLSISGNTLTLARAFNSTPNSGDAVYAGAYAAPAAAAAILTYVNGLGPSRASGLADNFNTWNDVASIWGAGNAACNVQDTDGTLMISRLAGTDGLTIAVGSGGASATDYEPPDTYTLPPQLAYVTLAYVTQASGT